MATAETRESLTSQAEPQSLIPPDLNVDVREFHCSNCGRFLAMVAIVEGTIAIKCRRCKELNVLNVRSWDNEGLDNSQNPV